MFTMVTAVCLMMDVTGAPVNSCYLMDAEEFYQSPELCNAQMYHYEMQRRKEIIKQAGDDAIIVVMTTCVKANENV